jgi:predicted Zn-dependent protease
MKRVIVIGVLAAGLGVCRVQAVGEDKREAVPEAIMKASETYNEAVSNQEAGQLEVALAGFQRVLAGAKSGAGADEKRIFSAAANNSGNLTLLKGGLGRAEFYYRQAVEWDSGNALAWNNLGAVLLKQGRIPDAQASFERAVKENPLLAMPLNNLARLLLETGNLQIAAEYLIVSLRINPGDPETLFLLARLYEQAGMPERQATVWKALVEVSGNSPESRLMLATHYVREGVLDQAEAVIAEILKEKPDYPEARLQMARLQGRRGQWKDAEITLVDLLKTYPADPAVRNDLAAVLAEQGRAKEAVDLAEEGTARFPRLAENWYVLGLCYDKTGDVRRAEAAFRKCVELKPAYARAWNDLGVIAVHRADKDGAYEAFSKALAADPYLPQVQYNFGRFLVLGQIDFDRGVRLMAAVADGNSAYTDQAVKFLDDLILIGQGKDPGWKGTR